MAAFFWIHAGANSNWATNGNWSATSGGGTNGAQPSVTSDVTFDGAGTHGNEASIISATQSVLTLTFTTGYTSSVTVNAALTIAGNFTDRTQHSWAGTFGLTISAASTITSNGQTWPNAVSFSGSNTKTLSGNWTISGTLTCATTTTTINHTAAEVLTIGGWTVTGTTAGNISVTITGGLWSGNGSNTISGTISLNGPMTVGSCHVNGCTLNYTSGTVTSTGVFTIDGSTTLNTNPISFSSSTISANSTITLNSLFTVAGALTIGNVSVTFAGTFGFYIDSLTLGSTAGGTQTLVNSITYTIVSSFNCFRSAFASLVSLTSNDGTLRANLVLLNFSSICYASANFTRIDASGGRPITVFAGTITDSPNVIVTPTTTIFYNPVLSLSKYRKLSLYNSSRVFQYR